MACTADMFQVITRSKPPGNVPDGMKVSFGKDASGSPVSSGPALSIGDFELWPLSYYDNRVSFGMVMYDPKHQISTTVEKKGARYIYKINIDKGGSIAFVGQSDQSVTMSFDEICAMLFINAVQK